MMSGLVSPKSLGLTDEQQITKLLKRTNILLKCLKINNYRILPMIAFTFVTSIYSFTTNMWETVCYGIPNAIITTIFAIHFNNLITYHLLLHFIICLYTEMKLNAMNERLLEMKRRKRFIRIRETLQSFDSLYSEINEYNTTFWSKILFTFWTLLGIIIVFTLYVCLFIKIDIVTKIMLSYYLCFLILIFMYIIFTASSVTYCANKSYKTLNSLFISYSKQNDQANHKSISQKLKVDFKNLIIQA